MFSFFGKTTRSIRAGNMGEDGPSILFLVQLILSSFFNLFMLIVGIIGWSKGAIYDRQNTFEALNAMPSVYTYMTIWATILFLPGQMRRWAGDQPSRDWDPETQSHVGNVSSLKSLLEAF